MAPLQKRALIPLLLGLLSTVVLAILFVTWGGVGALNDTARRLILSVLFVAMLTVAGILLGAPRKARTGAGVEVDERDLSILHRAPGVQLLAVMLMLAGWVIGLTEYYWEAGVMPIMWPYLMMWSALIVSTLAQSLGVLIG